MPLPAVGRWKENNFRISRLARSLIRTPISFQQVILPVNFTNPPFLFCLLYTNLLFFQILFDRIDYAQTVMDII
jgi:hypothetical protein